MQKEETKRLTIRCSQCGGDNIEAKAYMYWSDKAQDWLINEWADDTWCNDCEARVDIKECELVWSSELDLEKELLQEA